MGLRRCWRWGCGEPGSLGSSLAGRGKWSTKKHRELFPSVHPRQWTVGAGEELASHPQLLAQPGGLWGL